MFPLVSIITITYNSEKYLEQTILSVINQTYNNIEYIIIDGGSTDGTLSIIKKYEASFSKWISEPDKGISDAMNKGIEMANGDIIGLIHSDDWYETNAIEKIVKNYTNGDIIHGNVQYWKGNTKNFLFSANHDLLPNEMTINHMSVFVKKDIYLKFGKFRLDMKYAMDYELMLRFYLKGVHFYYFPDTLANMRLDGTSDTNWEKSLFESYLSKKYNGMKGLNMYSYYIYTILRTFISKKLSNSKFHFILVYVRKYFSHTKKIDLS